MANVHTKAGGEPRHQEVARHARKHAGAKRSHGGSGAVHAQPVAAERDAAAGAAARSAAEGQGEATDPQYWRQTDRP